MIELQDGITKAQLFRALINCIATSVGLGVLVYLAVMHGGDVIYAIAFACGWAWAYVGSLEFPPQLTSFLRESFVFHVSAAVIYASALCFWFKVSHDISNQRLLDWIFRVVTILAIFAFTTASIGIGSKEFGASLFNFLCFWLVPIGYIFGRFYGYGYKKILAERQEQS